MSYSEVLTPDQWLQRYEGRLIERANLTKQQAFEASHSVPFLDISDGYENQPEDAADEEISYWTE